jgi:predicted CXXCH cytochrome family protein
MHERRSWPWRLLAAHVCALLALPASIAAIQEKPSGPTETCVSAECHVDIASRRTMHGPVAQGKCEACHAVTDHATHRFEIVGEPSALCATCHTITKRTFDHTPVRQGNCTGCHDPHGSDHPVLLVADPTRGLCLSCHHEETADAWRFVHGPVAAGACILCHEPHSSWEPALLTEPPRELCLGCHAEVVPSLTRDRYTHAPVEQGCLTCHDAHASNVRYNLHESAPGLCYGCHADTQATLESTGVLHGALTDEGGCLVCHGAHSSDLPALQRRPEMELCLDCHDEPMETGDGRRLTDMAALLADNPDHHGPIREATCTACHQPHLAPEPRLLRKAYPPEFYAPFEEERYALCFECHLPEMVQSERGTGLTRFRNGDLNLHWLHVNRKKGRTCRACHEVHASKNPFHMRDSVPFGNAGWALEIRYEASADGGRCAPGCHRVQTYERGDDAAETEPSIGARP